MRGEPQYSRESMASMEGQLFAFLDKFGSATKRQIQEGLKWYKRKTEYVLGSQPSWLVAVGLTRSESKFGRLVLYHCRGEHVLGICRKCGRKNFHPSLKSICHRCVTKEPKDLFSRIVPGVDVAMPTSALPGRELKIQILGARWDRKLPMHVPGDRYDTNPGWEESMREDFDEDE